jgi:hypothetical protein
VPGQSDPQHPHVTEPPVSTSDAYLPVETSNESRQAQRTARLSNIVCVPQPLIGPPVHVYRLVGEIVEYVRAPSQSHANFLCLSKPAVMCGFLLARVSQSGNIGGPGRPRGSRNKLNDDFVAAIYEDWTKHGPVVLARVRKTNPTAYLRIVAALCPVRLDVETPEQAQFADMTADELREDILRNMEKLGLIPTAAVGHEQSCLTRGSQNRVKLAAENSGKQQ